jgi:predicted RNA polymerase sigma factor
MRTTWSPRKRRNFQEAGKIALLVNHDRIRSAMDNPLIRDGPSLLHRATRHHPGNNFASNRLPRFAYDHGLGVL